MGGHLTAAKVFTCISVFGLVIVPLNAIPWIITGTVEAWISAKRLQTFFRLSEIDLKSYYSIADADSSPPSVREQPLNTVTIRLGNFTWSSGKEIPPGSTGPREEVKNQLEEVDLTIRRGDLVGVIGKVGSGKSSLLNAVLGEMYQTDGMVEVSGQELQDGFGYVPQDNWIQQGTVLSNIQFSLANLDLEVYHDVIEACALKEDLRLLPAGDLTQIGKDSAFQSTF